ncbi:type II CAAX endopeptidase family protein [Bradyrhizobium sp. UFLA05-112]
MSDLENANPSAAGSVRKPRTWDFMETLLGALIACAAYLLSAQVLLTLILKPMDGSSAEKIDALWYQPNWQGAATILGSPAAVTVLWVATRKAGREFSEYLALNWPRPGQLLRAVGIVAVVFGLQSVLSYLVLGPQEQTTSAYIGVGGAGGLLIMLVGSCIAAPVVEELIVRGFMFRGWSETFLGAIGTIVLTSALWRSATSNTAGLGRPIFSSLDLLLAISVGEVPQPG